MSVYNLPQWMRDRRQWMLAGGGEFKKAPQIPIYDENGEHVVAGRLADKTNPANWLSFDDALRCAGELGVRMGYCCSEDDFITIIDLDNVNNSSPTKDPNGPEVLANQQYFIDLALANDWYMETSASGHGVHIVIGGKVTRDSNADGVEFYGHKGFVIMTGLHARGDIKDAGAANIGNFNQLIELRGADIRQDAVGDDLLARLAVLPSPDEQTELRKLMDNVYRLNPRYVEQEKGADLDHATGSILPELKKAGRSANQSDLDFLQGIYKTLKGHPDRDYMALRLFSQSNRWFIRKQKKHQKYLMEFTFPKAKAICMREEESQVSMRKMADEFYEKAMAEARAAKQLGSHNNVSDADGAEPAINSATPPGQVLVTAADEFRFLTASDLKNGPRVKWMIKNLLIENGLSCVHGESGAGKSFLVLDMMAALAAGDKSWFGNTIKRPVPVCCLALEGQGGLQKRVVGWERGKKRDFPEECLFFVDDFSLRKADMLDKENAERMGRFCAALNLKHGGMFNGLLVIDTLAQASNGADENSSRDMGELIQGMKYLRDKTGATVLIVHHSTKSEAAQMRGHGSLKAAMDMVIEVVKNAKTDSDVHCKAWRAEKVKDAQEQDFKPFLLKSDVWLDPDEDGEIENAAYIEELVHQESQWDDATESNIIVAIRPSAQRMTREQSGGKGSSAGGSGGGSGAGRRGNEDSGANSRNAPITKPPGGTTYSANEPAANDPRQEAQARMKAAGGKNQRAIHDAITNISTRINGAGKNGAPPGVHCAPLDEVIQEAVRLRPDGGPAGEMKKAIKRAINAMTRDDTNELGAFNVEKVGASGGFETWLFPRVRMG